MIDLKKALTDPSSVFRKPQDVLLENSLTKQQKIDILKRWEYDALELSVAQEENMIGPEVTSLQDEINAALHELGSYEDGDSAPTKQGG